MKKYLAFGILAFNASASFAYTRDSVVFILPDSVKAISFLAEITVDEISKRGYCATGIKTDAVTLSLEKFYFGASVTFQANNSKQTPVVKGLNVRGPDLKFDNLRFLYDWKVGETYKLLIAQATDSTGNFSLYSGYVFLPKENKWKLIGTLKLEGRWNTLQRPVFFYESRKKQKQIISARPGQVWCQRQNGSWKYLYPRDLASPVVNLLSHIDSLAQLEIDKKIITNAIAENKTEAKNFHDGVYYSILKEGNGRQVSVNDTVTAFYKGYLLSDNSVFDATKEKPAIFPLKRLIMGWQIGVPLCKVGGKIRIIIPSNLAYSIRTRAAKIPPNSILVFEIEVVDAKAPVN